MAKWAGIKSLIRVDSMRDSLREEDPSSTRYYISSLALAPKEAVKCVRCHWQLANNVYQVLDVHFREDQWIIRQRNAAANLSVLRKIAGTKLAQIDRHKAIVHKQMWVHGSAGFRDRLVEFRFLGLCTASSA